MKTLFVTFMIMVSLNAKAQSAICQGLSEDIAKVSHEVFIPVDTTLRHIVSAGLSPSTLPEFIEAATIYTEALITLESLNMDSAKNSCAPTAAPVKVNSPECQWAVDVVQAANAQFQQVHVVFATAISRGDFLDAYQLTPALFTSENFLNQVNANMLKICQ